MGEGSVNVPNIDDGTLAPILRSVLGPDAQLDGPWHGCQLHGGFGGQALYRFAGEARDPGGVRPWSAVLKVCPPEGEDSDPAAWDAPRREALAYGSGFLDQLPGPFVAPRCLGLTDRPDGSAWLWLEEIVDECPGPWSIDRFVLAAHHLGRFNGAFLAAGPLPEHTWFSRNWLRRYIAAEGVAAATIEVPADAPALLRQCFPHRSLSGCESSGPSVRFSSVSLIAFPRRSATTTPSAVTCSRDGGQMARSRQWRSTGPSPELERWAGSSPR